MQPLSMVWCPRTSFTIMGPDCVYHICTCLRHVSPCSCEIYTNLVNLDTTVKERYTMIVYKRKGRQKNMYNTCELPSWKSLIRYLWSTISYETHNNQRNIKQYRGKSRVFIFKAPSFGAYFLVWLWQWCNLSCLVLVRTNLVNVSNCGTFGVNLKQTHKAKQNQYHCHIYLGHKNKHINW